MVAAWMLYAAAVGALLALVAAALDRALRAAGCPARAVWAAAVAASLLVPAAAVWRGHRAAPATPNARAGALLAGGTNGADAFDRLLAAARERAEAAVEPRATWGALDRPLLVAWGAASASVLAWLALSHLTLARRRRAWRSTLVRGEPTLVSCDVGPAVVGVADARVVLPTWALALDARPLALLLTHEREHVRARDPLLLTGAALAAAALPWSPAAWWQLRRLRLAVEVDCDRRVLRTYPDVRAYGGLLLDVARHAAAGPAAPPLAVASLASRTTSLEQRIRVMTSRPTRRVAARSAALAAATAALAAAACETLRPTTPVPNVQPPTAANRDTVAEPANSARLGVNAGVASGSATAGPVTVDVQGPARRPAPNGTPEPTVRVRRASGAPAPLHIIDGREVPAADAERVMGALDPNAIETVEVLKDEAALRAYGEKARGGVVRITMKAASRGAAGNGSSAPAGPPRRQSRQEVATPRDGRPAPLFVIDGRAIDPADADSVVGSIDPDDIESVDVIKGEAAVALLGERVRNSGAVRITTKPGAESRRTARRGQTSRPIDSVGGLPIRRP